MKLQIFLLTILSLLLTDLNAQRRKKGKEKEPKMEESKSPMNASTFAGLKIRNIGPAFTSGRIADIAIHPENDNIWYVAVGSGGVWKTSNAGNTWTSLFDKQAVYSTGCVTIDHNNPSIIWVGSGENVGGRHASFGDGIYKSLDGGKTWKNMGLEASEHLSKIIVHPENSNIVWVASQGPLWSKGGERGFYKSTDGGETWNRTLGDDEWMGVTDIAVDPRDPNLIYAASWQRHRTVAAYMGGGPKSGIHKSTDGGETWTKLSNGLPGGKMGKIGLAISPQQPDHIYAAIELNRKKGGVYKSLDRGASWKKQSDAVSGATGPHYYQELYASPHAYDRLYLMDVRIQVTNDGGKNFRRLQERDKHSDNHAIVFKKDDPDYLLVGTDAGIYESHDLAENWNFFDNLPLTQYYKVAVDDREPFYHIFGGTQDNGSHGGPSRTDHRSGIRNSDWYKTLGADGHQSATEPGNPDIIYAETQQGGLHRVDLKTGDQVFVQPQPAAGEDFERFNWDAPIVVSPHNPARLYFASQRVWRSDNRGDSWTPISEDLTRNQNRIELPIMGRTQSWDSPWDVGAMSNYNTVTSLSESAVSEGLIYAGTDDGIFQMTTDGGSNWTKKEVGTISGVPRTSFVNDIKADLHDENTVYMALDNHKNGDYKPYLIKSMDKGMTWKSLTNGLPEKLLIWRLVQDHVDPNLLFIGTEFGIYFSSNGGDDWIKLKGDMPNISFRDLAIQKRENDLVGASFGRGFFVLDDYTPLRGINEAQLNEAAAIYPIKDALRFNPRSIASPQGTGEYRAKNPPVGAVITYHLAEGHESSQAKRKKAEKDVNKNMQNVPFPGYDALDAEADEEAPLLQMIIKDDSGNILNRIKAPYKKGMHRINWNLRKMSQRSVSLEEPRGGVRGFRRGGTMMPAGTYSATLVKIHDGETSVLAGPKSFNVVPLRSGTLEGMSDEITMNVSSRLESLQKKMAGFDFLFENSTQKVSAMTRAANNTNGDIAGIVKELHDLKKKLRAFDLQINGSDAKSEIGERNNPTVSSRMFVAMRGLRSAYGPTANHQQSLEIAESEFDKVRSELESMVGIDIPRIEKQLIEMGAPYIEGQAIPD